MWQIHLVTKLYCPLRFGLLSAILVLGFVQPVRSDDAGDSFTDNLLTDLAPILALFGEQVTKQFLSQTFTKWDCIIFSVCPIGIITAIVSAIRVAAPNSLKAVVGRARESDAMAELELLSSVSSEVCELWNGHAIVRVMGSPEVLELAHIERQGEEGDNNWGLYTLGRKSEATEKNGTDGEKKITWGIFADPPEQSGRDSERLSTNISHDIASSGPSTYAPNVSLNLMRRGESKKSPVAFAVLGILVQLGVLLFSGLITYHPRWNINFKKDGKTPVAAAYPLVLAGTLLISVGLYLCAVIIEERTTEQTWRASSESNDDDKKHYQVRLLWLQRKRVVNDQSFGSYAIFAQNPRECIFTSRPVPANGHLSAKEEKTPRQVLTISAVAASLLGYGLQFTGLRFMNWSATLAQLIGMVIMTSVRIWVRRDLASRPYTEQIKEGCELDWFALEFSKREDGLWPNRKSDSDVPNRTLWVVGFGGVDGNRSVSEEGGGLVDKAVRVRERLGLLSHWKGSSTEPAIAIAEAIEETMNILCADRKFADKVGEDFKWSVKAKVTNNYPSGSEIFERVHCSLCLDRGKWRARASEIEAILSLWSYSHAQLQDSRSNTSADSRNWFREGSSALRTQSIRLLGLVDPSLDRDLLWWGGRGTSEVVKKVFFEQPSASSASAVSASAVSASSASSASAVSVSSTSPAPSIDCNWFQIPQAHVVGSGKFESPSVVPGSSGSFRYKLASDNNDGGSGDEKGYRAVLSDLPVEWLYAQDVFSSFMWEIAEAYQLHGLPITGKTTANIANHPITWQSFSLENSALQKIVHAVERTKLASLEEAWTLIIPPLSFTASLPQVGIIIERVREDAIQYERTGRWGEIREIYEKLWEIFQPFGPQDALYCKAAATVTQSAIFISSALERYKSQKRTGDEIEHLSDAEEGILKTLIEKLDTNSRSCLAELYKVQKRDSSSIISKLLNSVNRTSNENTFMSKCLDQAKKYAEFQKVNGLELRQMKKELLTPSPDILGWTLLHYAAWFKVGIQRVPDSTRDPRATDLAGWTPLHYSAEQGDERAISILLQHGADIEMQGRDGMGALHCAAKEGKIGAVKLLLESGANEGSRDNSRHTPLHWGAWGGHDHVVKTLLQKGADNGARDNYGRTPLHLAAVGNRLETVERLLSCKGENAAAKDREGNTALHLATMHRGDVIKLFEAKIEENQELLSTENNRGDTVLHSAVREGCSGGVQSLGDLGVDMNMKNKAKIPALHLAAALGRKEEMNTIIKFQANVEYQDNSGNTALHVAVFFGRFEAAKLLIETSRELIWVKASGELNALQIATAILELDLRDRQ